MTLPAHETPRGRPRLTIVRGTRAPVLDRKSGTQSSGHADFDWRRIASAVVACTHELGRHLQDRRWVRVDEVLRERRELLAGLGRLDLDSEGRGCLRALQQAANESEAAIASMKAGTMGTARKHQ